jgi:hypothetical protein
MRGPWIGMLVRPSPYSGTVLRNLVTPHVARRRPRMAKLGRPVFKTQPYPSTPSLALRAKKATMDLRIDSRRATDGFIARILNAIEQLTPSQNVQHRDSSTPRR